MLGLPSPFLISTSRVPLASRGRRTGSLYTPPLPSFLWGLMEGQMPPAPAPGAGCRQQVEAGWPVFLGVDSGPPHPVVFSLRRLFWGLVAGPWSQFQLLPDLQGPWAFGSACASPGGGPCAEDTAPSNTPILCYRCVCA